MEYEDELQGGFLNWFPELSLPGKLVFDIGCGYGGRAVRFAELGAKQVIALEPYEKPCKEGKTFAATKRLNNVEFVAGAGEHLPFASNTIDIVTSYDVFEHVHNLADVLDECVRVLKPEGTLYAVFPPFYHPTGAHLESWVSRMPWPNVLFRCETLISAVNDILKDRNDGYSPNPLRPNDRLWNLNGATIRSVKALLADKRFSNVRLSLYPLFSPMNRKWDKWKMKYYASVVKPLRNVPVLQELFVHRIVLKIRK